MELRLKLVAVICSDGLNAERELLTYMVYKVDSIYLRMTIIYP